MMTTKEGIALYTTLKNKGDLMAHLCTLREVESVEHLTSSEIVELNEMLTDYMRVFTHPPKVEDVRLAFNVQGYRVELDKFSELDITVRAIEMMNNFNPEELEAITVFIGCIYAPFIKEVFSLPQGVPQIAAEIAESIGNEVPFAEAYAVFDFFVFWKGIYSRGCAPSLMDSLQRYRLARSVETATRDCILQWSTASQTPLSSGITK